MSSTPKHVAAPKTPTHPTVDSRTLAGVLIAEEIRVGKSTGGDARAAIQVCEKMRPTLSTLAGIAGFRAVMSRALTLATADVPWLGGIQIGANGALALPAELSDTLNQADAARGAKALVAQLLGLLVTFIGEALTLRLVQNVWPKLSLEDSASGSDKI